jgi:uncharacterized protein (DUF1697 family)
MTPHIALLRAVNVSGRSVAMAELRALFDALGFPGAKTLLQSGNVVFDARGADAALEARLETAFEARFGFAADFIVRSAAEWGGAIAANPFPAEARADPAHLLMMPLKGPPSGALDWPGPERIEIRGRDAYLVYPQGIGRSKLTVARIEKALGVRGTGRNWATVLKLAEASGLRAG